jgi:hypothetical protein
MANQLLWALTQLVAGVAVLYVAWTLLDGKVDMFVMLLVIAFLIGIGFFQSRTPRSK